jgi:ribose transport system ATP-binding protein
VQPATPLLEIRGLEKVFPNGTVALSGVDLEVHPGETHGLVGANGAGKSTLAKIVAGALFPSRGSIMWEGRAVHWRGPADARNSGIGTIYQNTPLVPTLSVVDNVFLGRGGFLIRRDRRREEYDRLVEKIGVDIDPDALVGFLPVGQRQLVAILQALAENARLVVMDEPTAALAESERQALWRTMNQLKQSEGTGFLYISHFLGDVMDLTDSLTVLRDGAVALNCATTATSEADLATALIGHRIARAEATLHGPNHALGQVALDVKHLCTRGRVEDVSLSVREGEVVGLAGILGAGRSEILHGIFGAEPNATGSVHIFGQEVRRAPGAAVAAGIALLPEDRDRQGLLRAWEIWRNTSLPDLSTFVRGHLFLNTSAEMQRARDAISSLGIIAQSPATTVSELSGGNAQKVMFAKWMFGDARVLLLDEPTAGVDVGAKADIQDLIRKASDQGRAILLVSSEFDELLMLASRVLVVRAGRIVADLMSADTSEAALSRLAGSRLE